MFGDNLKVEVKLTDMAHTQIVFYHGDEVVFDVNMDNNEFIDLTTFHLNKIGYQVNPIGVPRGIQIH